MFIIFFLITFFFTNVVYSYQLNNYWLSKNGCTINRTSEINNLSTTVGLNISTVLTDMNTSSVTNIPLISNGSIVSIDSSTDTLYCIRYCEFYDENGNPDFLIQGRCDTYFEGELDRFSIRLNKFKDNEWGSSSDKFDINSVLRHELGHALGLDHTQQNDNALMLDNLPPNTTRYLTEDDIDGLKHIYDPPEIELFEPSGLIADQNDSYSIVAGQVLSFKISVPLLKGSSNSQLKLRAYNFKEEVFGNEVNLYKYGDNSLYNHDSFTYVETIDDKCIYNLFIETKSEDVGKQLGFIIFNDRTESDLLFELNGNIFTNINHNIIKYKVKPKTEVKSELDRSSKIIVKSKITEYDGITDFPVDNVKFYVKKENESDFTEIEGEVNTIGDSPKYYWKEWDGFATGQGNYYLKSRAYYTVDDTEYTVTDSVLVELPKAYCQIVSPLPNEVVDLHYPKGLGFDLKGEEHLDSGYNLHMAVIGLKDGLNYLPYIMGNKENYKGIKGLKPFNLGENNKPLWKVSPYFNNIKEKRSQTIANLLNSSDRESVKALHGVTWMPNKYIPGEYKLWCAVSNAEQTAFEAFPKSINFRIPKWSFHYKNLNNDNIQNQNYIPKVHYRRGGIVQLGLYAFQTMTNDVFVTIKDEDENPVYSFVLSSNDKGYYHEWQTSKSMKPGFYTLVGTEKDGSGNSLLVQESKIQLVPLYVDFENNGNWPLEWPGEDTHNWRIHTGVPHPNIGTYTMSTWYETKDHTELSYLTHQGIELESGREYEIRYSLGIKKNQGNDFDPLYADYSLQVKKDGEWITVKTIDPSQYINLPWQNEPMYCLLYDKFSLGTGSEDENLQIRFKIEGNPEFYTPIDDDNKNKIQEVLYDNIIIAYKEKSGLSAPRGLEIVDLGEGKAKLSWGYSNIRGEYQVFEKFRVYKNGIKVAETIEKEYLDKDIEANTIYSYAVTAVYRGKDSNLITETPRTNCISNFSAYCSIPFTENFESGYLSQTWNNKNLSNGNSLWHIVATNENNYAINVENRDGEKIEIIRLETPYFYINDNINK